MDLLEALVIFCEERDDVGLVSLITHEAVHYLESDASLSLLRTYVTFYLPVFRRLAIEAASASGRIECEV